MRRQVGWYCETVEGDADYGKHRHQGDRPSAGWCSMALMSIRRGPLCAKAVPVYIDDESEA